jgi:hypothetical protein
MEPDAVMRSYQITAWHCGKQPLIDSIKVEVIAWDIYERVFWGAYLYENLQNDFAWSSAKSYKTADTWHCHSAKRDGPIDVCFTENPLYFFLGRNKAVRALARNSQIPYESLTLVQGEEVECVAMGTRRLL